ncbi:MAG: hypothetical protein DRJ03_12030 [Chloroflexi bacterium]|nr:MAG: hypothetical protein DRJ03_12030 [Chloroflexota bacterium]
MSNEPIGKCLFCGKDVFKKDIEEFYQFGRCARIIQFSFQGKLRFGCTAHPGMTLVMHGENPPVPPGEAQKQTQTKKRKPPK